MKCRCYNCQKLVETTPIIQTERKVVPITTIDRENLVRSKFETTYTPVEKQYCNYCGYIGDDFIEEESKGEKDEEGGTESS